MALPLAASKTLSQAKLLQTVRKIVNPFSAYPNFRSTFDERSDF